MKTLINIVVWLFVVAFLAYSGTIMQSVLWDEYLSNYVEIDNVLRVCNFVVIATLYFLWKKWMSFRREYDEINSYLEQKRSWR